MATIKSLAYQVADADHKRDVWRSMRNTPYDAAKLARRHKLLARVPGKTLRSPKFVDAYNERRRELNQQRSAMVRSLACQLADIEYELGVHFWQSKTPFYDAIFARWEEIDARIQAEDAFCAALIAAYEERKREREKQRLPFVVIDGGAS